MAKFYFGLIRFVCVMLLLLPADLNNNNTEFDLGGGWVTIPIIESNQLYWLRLSWVLTILSKRMIIDKLEFPVSSFFFQLLPEAEDTNPAEAPDDGADDHDDDD